MGHHLVDANRIQPQGLEICRYEACDSKKNHEKWVNLSHIKMVNESDERGTPKYGKMAGLEWDQNP